MSAVTSSYFLSRREGEAAEAGTEQAVVAVAGQSSGQEESIFSRCNDNFFLTSLKCSHMVVCHLEMCVCGVKVCGRAFFPVEVFLRVGGSHPIRTRLKQRNCVQKGAK